MSELDLKATSLRQASEQSFQQLKIDSATWRGFLLIADRGSCGSRRRLYAIAASAAFSSPVQLVVLRWTASRTIARILGSAICAAARTSAWSVRWGASGRAMLLTIDMPNTRIPIR
ncbi:hypothetical protein CA51_10690 [Rosistilla oblonga]|nr:hypothetical protein CA51_10690 [Rosistilla oblonga]